MPHRKVFEIEWPLKQGHKYLNPIGLKSCLFSGQHIQFDPGVVIKEVTNTFYKKQMDGGARLIQQHYERTLKEQAEEKEAEDGTQTL